MKYIKTFKNLSGAIIENKENHITIEIWNVPYTVKQKGNQFTMKNCFGMDGLSILKRKNPHNEPYGERSGNFGVYVESENEITITIFDKMVNEYHDGDIIDALVEAVDIIENYYNSVGWEFLNTPEN